MVKSGLKSPTVPTELAADLAETGWRDVEEVQPDGTRVLTTPRSPLEDKIDAIAYPVGLAIGYIVGWVSERNPTPTRGKTFLISL